MCDMAIVDGEDCITASELGRALGIEVVYRHNSQLDPEACFCNIDVEASIEKAGAELVEYDGFIYEIKTEQREDV